jgi:protein arginine N-methyltransferase 7
MTSARYLNSQDSSNDAQVTSVEMSSAMAKLAQLTVASNDLQEHVHITEGHSCEIDPLPEKAQLCTSELLESGLLGEGMLPALRDAWERHLDSQAVIVPQRARVFAQVIEGGILSNYWGPHQWTTDFPNNRTLRLCTSSKDEDVMLGGSGLNGIQIPLHAGSLFSAKNNSSVVLPTSIAGQQLRKLSEPIQVLEIDVSSKDAIPGPEGQSKKNSFVPIASGKAQGVLFWWELDMWDDLMYSTELGKEPWQDHWHQCLFIFPKPREECCQLTEGRAAILAASHDDSRIYFEIRDEPTDGEEGPPTKRACPNNENALPLISPERAYQLNDLQRTRVLREGIQATLARQGCTNAVVLDLSDFSLCAMIAALQGAECVTSLETSSNDIPMTSARVAQVANGLVDPDNPSAFQIVQCHAEQLSVDILGGKAVNVVVAEPYYEMLEGWHLQEALNYFYLVRSLKQRGVISSDAVSVPAFAAVMGCAIEAFDLGKAYKGCDSTLRGFKHNVMNEYGDRFHEFDLSLPMWQYDYKQLTDNVELARIDYNTCDIANNRTIVRSKFRTAGQCHALLVWIDYGIPAGQGSHTLSTKEGGSYRQLLRMLPKVVSIEDKDIDSDTTVLCCSALLGNLKGLDDHQFDVWIEKG